MTKNHRDVWTLHEIEFLYWMRLRGSIAAAIDIQSHHTCDEKEFMEDTDRPWELQGCSKHCFRNVMDLLKRQGLVLRQGPRFQAPITSTVAIEAAWRLVPDFNERWSELWDLAAVESCGGADRFTLRQLLPTLEERIRKVHGSPLHRRAPRYSPPVLKDRLHGLVVSGWLEPTGNAYRLSNGARDALTLFRLVVRPTTQVPEGSLAMIRTRRKSLRSR